MLRFFARLSIRIAVILCAIVGAIRLVGATIPQQKSAILQQFDCTPKPCWHGIHIGATDIPDAANMLNADKTIRFVNYNPLDDHVCWQWQNQWHDAHRSIDGCYQLTNGVDLPPLVLYYANSPIRLGDMIGLWGLPNTSRLCSRFRYGDLSWADIEIEVQVPSSFASIDPDLMISQISYFSSPISAADLPTLSSWKGLLYWGRISADCGG